MPDIKDALIDMNPWWKRDAKLEFKDRDIYAKIKKFLPLPQIIAFTGLRRVGKTTLMLKILNDYIDGGFEKRNIIYFSFDEFKSIEIRQILREFEELNKRDIHQGKYILILDEVQRLENWEYQLKSIYDNFKGNIKILASGSESLFIKRKAKAALAGRIFEFKVESLTFKEFLYFKDKKLKEPALYKRELQELFEEFMFTQGFPELVGIKDKEIIKKYIKEGIIDKIIYKDIPGLFNIKDPSLLDRLLNIFMEEPGQIVDLSDLADDLGITRQTLSNYLGYLEGSFLIRKLYNFSKNRRKIERKLKKYYPAIISVNLLFKEDALARSRVFEWLMVMQLKAEFFWRDSYKNEVDIVSDRDIPIEIKYGKVDYKGVEQFMDKFNINKGYIISQKEEKQKAINKRKIMVIPAYRFLLE